jgi:hypothetical protein
VRKRAGPEHRRDTQAVDGGQRRRRQRWRRGGPRLCLEGGVALTDALGRRVQGSQRGQGTQHSSLPLRSRVCVCVIEGERGDGAPGRKCESRRKKTAPARRSQHLLSCGPAVLFSPRARAPAARARPHPPLPARLSTARHTSRPFQTPHAGPQPRAGRFSASAAALLPSHSLARTRAPRRPPAGRLGLPSAAWRRAGSLAGVSSPAWGGVVAVDTHAPGHRSAKARPHWRAARSLAPPPTRSPSKKNPPPFFFLKKNQAE